MKLTKKDKQLLKDIEALNNSGVKVSTIHFLAGKYSVAPSTIHWRLQRLIAGGYLEKVSRYEVL